MKKILLFGIAFCISLIAFGQVVVGSNATTNDTSSRNVVIDKNGETRIYGSEVVVYVPTFGAKNFSDMSEDLHLAISEATEASLACIGRVTVSLNDNFAPFITVESMKNGTEITEKREVSKFTAIDASSSFKITVKKGDTESLSITADESLMPYLRSEVKNGVLKLYYKDHTRVGKISTPEVQITMRNLEKVALSGVCSMDCKDVFQPNNFIADLSGISRLKIEVNPKGNLTCDLSGASNLDIVASASKAIIDISGTGKMTLKLNAPKATFDLSGSSNIKVSGKSESAIFDVSGIAKINAFDYELKKANIDISGSSQIEVNASDELAVDASGISAVYYKGRPSFKSIETSGVSKIKHVD